MDIAADVPEITEAEIAPLPDSGAYTRYFKLLDSAFHLMTECVKVQSKGDTFETSLVEDMLKRLRYTMGALRVKNAFPEEPSSRGSMHVDMNESGFPNHYDFTKIDVDLVDRDSLLKDMPSGASLNGAIIKCLLTEQVEPMRLLATRAKRAYLEMLERDNLFLPLTFGPVTRWNQKNTGGVRGYVAGWGSYDPNRNMPFVYTMYFEQDESEQPLEEQGENFAKFLKVLRFESYHAPDKLNLLATGIDEALDPIHPKVIKRIRIGPLYTPLLIRERPSDKRSNAETVILDLFERVHTGDGFALFFNEEIISSIDQRVERRLFSSIAREVFYVPPLDDGANEAGSSRVHHHLLMPHSVYQAIQPEDARHLPRYHQRIKFSYDAKERIHEIG
ncbi:MAG TPA: hypothetical protein VJB97_01005 [Candidatus Paceibacterota bacterium]